MYLHSWARVKIGSPNPIGTCHPCLAWVSTDRFIVWPTSSYLNKDENEITVNEVELVRTIPLNNDFVADSRFDCNVVLSDIYLKIWLESLICWTLTKIKPIAFFHKDLQRNCFLKPWKGKIVSSDLHLPVLMNGPS